MALETGSYISNLVSSNPTGSDRKLQGDDHLRLIKSVLQNSFAGLTGAVMVGGANGGVVNAYTLTPTPPLVSYVVNMTVIFTPTFTNTGASTLNISALGVLNLLTVDGAALAAGDLVAGQTYSARYNGTDLRLTALTKRYVDQLAFSTALPGQGGNSGKFLTTDGTNASWSDTVPIPFNFTSRLNEAKGANIASAATIDLSTATGNLVHVTGTTTITAITIPSGAERTVVFDGILTLTHNATTLILPTGANITTAAGDVIKVRGDGAGNARVVTYQRANGTALSVTPPALILLATLTPTASANVDSLSTFTSTYDNYRIIGEGITNNAAGPDIMNLRFANAGVVDTGSNYRVQSTGFNGGSMSAAATSIGTTVNVQSAGTRGMNFNIEIENANSSTLLKSCGIRAVSQSDGTPTFQSAIVHGAYTASATISGIRFFWNGGSNFGATGTIRIYGYNNS